MLLPRIPLEEVRHSRAVQQWLEEDRQQAWMEGWKEGWKEGWMEGRQEGKAAAALRLLNRCCGPLSDATRARIQSLPLEQLEALLDALLDFEGHADLEAWLQSPI